MGWVTEPEGICDFTDIPIFVQQQSVRFGDNFFSNMRRCRFARHRFY